jgi:signal peptidase I
VPDKTEFFVLGDHRQDSRDSRTFGPVRRRNIIGKVWVRYWPLGAWGKPG